MKILITGGAGFIGSHLAACLSKVNDVVILDNMSTGKTANLKGIRHRMIYGDINDTAKVERAMMGVDEVYHLAAMTSVTESMIDPCGCVESNINGTIKVLEAAKRNLVRRLTFASSCAIYGGAVSHANENTVPMPLSPYAMSKLAGEHLIKMYGIETVALRFFNVYGPRQSSHYAAVIPTFIQKALNNKPIYINGTGSQTRDFIHVDNVVHALTGRLHQTTNVGTGVSTRILDLARMIINITGSKSEIKYFVMKPGEIYTSKANNERLKSHNFKLKSLEDGLIELIASYK
jgi:UDP-glucose 4-epimerase